MRKYLVLLVVVAGLAIPVAALAASWPDPPGQNADLVALGADCENGDDGAWYHFVNNQTGGAGAGELSANFVDASDDQSGIDPLAVNQNVQHFYVFGESMIISATTNLPGKLVISGIACGKKTDSPRDLFD